MRETYRKEKLVTSPSKSDPGDARGVGGMQPLSNSRLIVTMGVSGSGKSTVGRLLAENLGSAFTEGDGLHSDDNISLMAAGHALNDSDRLPWLRAVGEHLASFHDRDEGVVVACSALKKSYREVLREYVPGVFFIFLDGPLDVVQKRIAKRCHEFMPPSLLASQFESLEPLDADENGIRVDIRLSPNDIVAKIKAELGVPHDVHMNKPR
jgi:gluconokinase